jgi:hypothetical protein
MAHKFDRSKDDPYVVAAHQIEQHVFASRGAYDAGAGEEIYGELSDALVTGLGDIAAQAFRLGVNQPRQVKGLADAIRGSAEAVILSYLGEVDPAPVLDAIARDPRRASLPPVDAGELTREIEKTRQLEELVLSARRLPALMDFAASLGLQEHEDALDQAAILVPGDYQVGPGAAQLE